MTIHIRAHSRHNEPTGTYWAEWQHNGQPAQCDIPAAIVGDDREILWTVVRAGCQPTRDFTIERHY